MENKIELETMAFDLEQARKLIQIFWDFMDSERPSPDSDNEQIAACIFTRRLDLFQCALYAANDKINAVISALKKELV